MRDIACADYVAGCNTKFFATGQTSGGVAKVSDCKERMMKRLAFADDVGAPYDSMLAFPAAAGQFINGALDTVMSITSRLLPWEVQSTSRPNSHKSFPGGEEMYKKYANALQLHSIHFGEDMKASENMEFISQGARFVPTSFTFVHGTQRPSPHTARRLDEQCAVLHRAAPPLRPVCARLLLARARTGSLWPRCAAPALQPPLRRRPASPLSFLPRRRDSRRLAVETRRERLAQDGERFDGLHRAGRAGADDLPEEVNVRRERAHRRGRVNAKGRGNARALRNRQTRVRFFLKKRVETFLRTRYNPCRARCTERAYPRR